MEFYELESNIAVLKAMFHIQSHQEKGDVLEGSEDNSKTNQSPTRKNDTINVIFGKMS